VVRNHVSRSPRIINQFDENEGLGAVLNALSDQVSLALSRANYPWQPLCTGATSLQIAWRARGADVNEPDREAHFFSEWFASPCRLSGTACANCFRSLPYSLPLVIGIWSQLDSGACWDIFAGAVSRTKVTLTGSASFVQWPSEHSRGAES